MADELTLVVTAIVNQAVAGLKEVQAQLNSTGVAAVATHTKGAVAAKVHATAVQEIEKEVGFFEKTLHRAGDEVARVIGLFTGFQGLLAAGAGLFVLDRLIKGVYEFNDTATEMTAVFAGNARAATSWMAVADMLDVSYSELELGLKTLSKDILSNASVFHSLHIATVDAKGNFYDLNTVLLESADYFHKHAGEVTNLAYAQALFGRSGEEMLPMLEQGRDAIQLIIQQAEKYGLVMDNSMVARNAQMTETLDVLQMAAKGLAINLGESLLPIIAALASALSNLIQTHLQQFIAWVNSAVSYVLGAIEAFTGWRDAIDDVMRALGAVEEAKRFYGNTNQNVANSTRAVTDAIQNEISALQSKQQLLEQNIQDQIKQLELEGEQENFVDQQTKAQQKKADDQKKIDKLRSDYSQALLIGDLASAQDIYDQLTSAQQGLANDMMDIQKASDDHIRKEKINSLQTYMDDERRKNAEQIKKLEDAQRAASQNMQEAVVGGFSAGVNQGVSNFKDAIDKFAKDPYWEGKGKEMGTTITTWIHSKLIDFANAARTDGPLKAALETLGEVIADSLASGFAKELKKGLTAVITNPLTMEPPVVKSLVQSVVAQYGPASSHTAAERKMIHDQIEYQYGDAVTKAAGYAVGGIIPGPINAERIIKAHGGEEIIPANSVRNSSSSSHRTQQIGPFFITGSKADAEAIRDAVRKELVNSFGLR